MTESKGRDWSAWTLGVLASAVGAGVAAFVARRLSEPLGLAVGEAMGPVLAEVAIGALVMGAMTLGVAPGLWLAGRRHRRWAGPLALALPLSGAVAGAAGLGVWAGSRHFGRARHRRHGRLADGAGDLRGRAVGGCKTERREARMVGRRQRCEPSRRLPGHHRPGDGDGRRRLGTGAGRRGVRRWLRRGLGVGANHHTNSTSCATGGSDSAVSASAVAGDLPVYLCGFRQAELCNLPKVPQHLVKIHRRPRTRARRTQFRCQMRHDASNVGLAGCFRKHLQESAPVLCRDAGKETVAGNGDEFVQESRTRYAPEVATRVGSGAIRDLIGLDWIRRGPLRHNDRRRLPVRHDMLPVVVAILSDVTGQFGVWNRQSRHTGDDFAEIPGIDDKQIGSSTGIRRCQEPETRLLLLGQQVPSLEFDTQEHVRRIGCVLKSHVWKCLRLTNERVHGVRLVGIPEGTQCY